MEHEHVTLQSSEDYQELFERFLSAAGISPAEFKAYLAASVPHCGALRTVKNGLAAETAYEGIFLSENSYIIMDTLRTPETRVSRQEMEEYLRNSAFPEKIRCDRETLTEADEMAEFMFLGLRMTEGVSVREFEEYFGKNMESIYGEVLKNHFALGMLKKKNDRIFLTRRGIHVSNGVMADFLL